MKDTKHLVGLDYFKVVAALLVIAIHTSPLSTFNTGADFIFSRIIARIAVPFFLMVTGYFVLSKYLFGGSVNSSVLRRSIYKALVLYAIAIITYLPVNIYAGQLKGIGILGILQKLIFDGTFYHLWYLPAAILGMLLIYLLRRRLPFKAVWGIAILLYVLGLLGDSYFGLVSKIPAIEAVYNAGFRVYSYTRNGIFYAPVFLIMGAWLGRSQLHYNKKVNISGFIISLLLMIIEGLILHHLGAQRHDSMYIALLPCMFFLFQIIESLHLKQAKYLRGISTWIYRIHPLFIIIVRGFAKITHLTNIFVDNSLIHYLIVSSLSCLFALVLVRLLSLKNKEEYQKGRAWIEISRENLRHNVNELNSLLPYGCQLMPAIKANAYGHGAVLVAKELNSLGVSSFCVATVLEGVELRRNGIKGEILILGYTHPKQFFLLRKYHLIQTVIDYSYAKVLNAYGKKVKVHLKIDTGMHRLGERSEKIDDICNIFNCKNLLVEGAYTHLCADDTTLTQEKAFTMKQGTAFFEVISKLKELGYICLKVHLQASYGLLNFPELSGDYARIGIALYGVLSNREDMFNRTIDLLPILSVKARIASIKDLFKGENAGYGLQYIANQDKKIAICAIGYADGLPRSMSCGNGKVLINGCEAPIIGRICMDQTLVDISDISNVMCGDIAVIIGKSGNSEISAYDLAEQAETITNELLSRLSARLERVMI